MAVALTTIKMTVNHMQYDHSSIGSAMISVVLTLLVAINPVLILQGMTFISVGLSILYHIIKINGEIKNRKKKPDDAE